MASDFPHFLPQNPINVATGVNSLMGFKELSPVLDIMYPLRTFTLTSKMEKKTKSFVSRTGRRLQRYNNGCRQVVGCIPYRFKRPDEDASMGEELEVLIISSQKSRSMMFPKGGWERDESMENAAMRETMEEAGVEGSLGCHLGRWVFRSKSQGTYREGFMFSLLVEKQLDDWPEKDLRHRKWMKVSDAREKCQYEWMKEALDMLVVQQNQGVESTKTS